MNVNLVTCKISLRATNLVLAYRPIMDPNFGVEIHIYHGDKPLL